MSSYESRHFVRLLSSSQDIATGFIKYCHNHNVVTRGLCRIGYVARRPPAAAATAVAGTSASAVSSEASVLATTCRLRGLIANKDIAKDENIVVVSERACIDPGTAIRCTEFFSMFPQEIQAKYFLSPEFLRNSRIAERALIRHNQLLLALYMAFLTIMRTCDPQRLAALPGADAIAYMDFMPRTEGNFEQLAAHLDGWLNGTEVCRIGQDVIADALSITQAEVRPVIVYALCMIYSRMVPIDHRATLQFAFRDTPLADAYADNTFVQADTADSPLVSEPISFLCPIIDMCNHSEHENVAVMVPERDVSPITGPLVCLRSLRDISKGEELTMTYSKESRELKLIWGMQEVLV